jgi:hypothetical protein
MPYVFLSYISTKGNRFYAIWTHQFGLFMSVNLGQLQPPSVFAEMSRRQLITLENIEAEDGTNENVHDQVIFFSHPILSANLRADSSFSAYNGEQQEDTWFSKHITLQTIHFRPPTLEDSYWQSSSFAA